MDSTTIFIAVVVFIVINIIGIAVTAIGFMITMFSVYAWSFEPVNDPEDSH